ncbi:MAG: glycosyltransferase family 2 protein [Candidatus Pacearchaeota archaeon]|jgi:cellulose synthase/poly-beta-1,6-N-acetylglucosamine synthase-like glycosyltransferase
MISIIITAYKEPSTIGKAIEQILKNNLTNYEILVTAPDNETLNVAKIYSKRYKFVRTLKDEGKGKPAALNLAVSNAKGNILILTDGDVYVGGDSLSFLIKPFENPKIGAVSGNPVSLNSRKNRLGFWAYVLTSIASKRRLTALKLKRRFFCSGYLFAIKKSLFPKLPEELLSEDGFISNNVYKKGYNLSYSEKSKVYVKYPTTFDDWVIQKKRSAGGYNQIRKMTNVEMRSFRKESLGGFSLLRYVSNPLEFFWLIELFLARVYLWLVIYRDININKKSHKEIWKRVETTK